MSESPKIGYAKKDIPREAEHITVRFTITDDGMVRVIDSDEIRVTSLGKKLFEVALQAHLT